MLTGLKNIASQIKTHPLSQGAYLKRYMNVIKWQAESRLHTGQREVPWIDDVHLLAANGDTGLTGNIYTGLAEPDDMAFVLFHHRPEDLFVDIGANCGIYTLLAAGAVGSKAIAIEPVPSTYERLKSNIEFNKLKTRVQTLNVGCGSKKSTLTFTSQISATNHVATTDDIARLPQSNLVEIMVHRLDDLIDINNGLKEDTIFIKIDVEGFELEVLKGASKLLSSDFISAILVEINENHDRYDYTAEDLHTYLVSLGYIPCRFNLLERQIFKLDSYNTNSSNTIYVRNINRTNARIQSSRRQYMIHTIGRIL